MWPFSSKKGVEPITLPLEIIRGGVGSNHGARPMGFLLLQAVMRASPICQVVMGKGLLSQVSFHRHGLSSEAYVHGA